LWVELRREEEKRGEGGRKASLFAPPSIFLLCIQHKIKTTTLKGGGFKPLKTI